MSKKLDFIELSSEKQQSIFVLVLERWTKRQDFKFPSFVDRSILQTLISDLVTLMECSCERQQFMLQAVVYADMFVSSTAKQLPLFELMIVSVLVAIKFWEDEPSWYNDNAAEILRKTVKDINTSERLFLRTLNYNLYLDGDRVGDWFRKILCNTSSLVLSTPSTSVTQQNSKRASRASINSPQAVKMKRPASIIINDIRRSKETRVSS